MSFIFVSLTKRGAFSYEFRWMIAFIFVSLKKCGDLELFNNNTQKATSYQDITFSFFSKRREKKTVA